MSTHLYLHYAYDLSQGFSSLYRVFIPASQMFFLILLPKKNFSHLCWLDKDQRYRFLVKPLAEEDPGVQALKDKFISE